jgi:hypothetical protein
MRRKRRRKRRRRKKKEKGEVLGLDTEERQAYEDRSKGWRYAAISQRILQLSKSCIRQERI